MPPKTLDQRFAELRREVQRELRPLARPIQRAATRATSWRDVVPVLFYGMLKVTAVVVLPFVVYVRASVYIYNQVAAPWLAVIGGALLTMAVIAGYATWLSRRVAGRARLESVSRWVALPLVAAWCAYSVVHLARTNAKSDAVHSYYTSVHPVLRAALATVILADPSLVLTDAQRAPEDYVRMGLPINARTLHYRQADGWVHAVDLRTRERSEIKNRTVQLYFWIMGFETLRHVGTADHLHVQLTVRN